MRFTNCFNNPPFLSDSPFTGYLIGLVLLTSSLLPTIADLHAETNAWSKVSPEVAHVSAIGISRSSHNVLYVGTAYGGVQKSSDGGQSWVNTSQMVQNVTAVLVDPADPNTVFVGAFDGGIFNIIVVFVCWWFC